MLFPAMVFIVTLSAIWVYWDATRWEIGKIPGKPGLFNLPAGGWGIVTLLLWIVGFPAYLSKRSDLIAQAKTHPLNAPRRVAKVTGLAVAGGIWMLSTLNSALAAGLPACGSADATGLVGRLMIELPAVNVIGVEYVEMKDVQDLGLDQTTDVRRCRGTLVTSAGEDTVSYTIRWEDEATRQFYVEAQVVN